MLLEARILINERNSEQAGEILSAALEKLRCDADGPIRGASYLTSYALYYLSLINRDASGERFRVEGRAMKPRRVVASSLPLPPEEISVS